MNSMMKSILSRVLSEEIAKQEVWSKENIEMFGEHMNRDTTLQAIKDFMTENNIEFREDWYYKQIADMQK